MGESLRSQEKWKPKDAVVFCSFRETEPEWPSSTITSMKLSALICYKTTVFQYELALVAGGLKPGDEEQMRFNTLGKQEVW